MKNKKSKRFFILSIVITVLFSIGLPKKIEAATFEDYQYGLINNNTEIQITGYNGPGGDIIILSKIEGKPVTNIGYRAFLNNQLTSIVIPKSVTSIGEGAFFNNQLTNVNIPENVTSIEDWTFNANQLTSIIIPESVTSIGNHAFASNKLTGIIIPESVTSIGDAAFICNQLTSIIIPENVTKIGDYAFGNNQLASVNIPENVTSIEDFAFSHNQLTGIVIPKSVTSIGDGAFFNNQLTSVNIPKNVTSIGDYAFENNQLTNIIIPESVEFIGEYAFDSHNIPSKDVTIYGILGSKAELYANEYGYTFKPLSYEDSLGLDRVDISKISNKFIDLEKGEKKQLVVDMWSDNLLIKWSSSDSSVVTVDNMGVINAVGYGETIINASNILGMNDIQCYVSVKGISLNKNKIELLKDQTETLIAEFSPYSSKVKWETSDSDVASIKVDGNKCKVTSKNSGNATITAEINIDGKKVVDACRVSVINYPPEDIAQAYADYLMNSGFIGESRNEVEDKLGVQLPIYWCAAFVGETAKAFGLSKIIPLRPGVGDLYRDILSSSDNPAKGFYFIEKDKYNVKNSTYTNRNNFTPKVGDLVIFKWDSAGSNITFSHVGVVTKVETPKKITVVHGNNIIDENTGASNVGKWESLNFIEKKKKDDSIVENKEVVAFVRPDYGAISKEWTGEVKHSFKCPVDVCVIFDGEELNSATNFTATSFGTMTIEEDCITVILDYGNPYNIVVTGKDEGTMKLTTEFDTNHGQNTRSFIDIPITKDTTIHVYADAATAGIELLVEPNDAEITETLWHAEPGDIVSKADEELTESYLNRSWYEEDDDSNQTEWKTWEPEYDIALDKTWTVEFNKTPDATTIKGSNIYVTDQNNQVVSTSLYQQSNKKVRVIPAKNYQSGHTYILWIKGLKAEDGSLLDKDVKMEFTIK